MNNNSTFKRVMISLNGTWLDPIVLNYSAHLLSNYNVEQVFLIHIQEESTHLVSDSDTLEMESYLNDVFAIEFKTECKDIETLVLNGKPSDIILRQAHIKDIDLFVLGMDHMDLSQKRLSNWLFEHLPCPVLLIPETATPEINELLIPLDFSQSALMALNEAYLLKNRLNADLYCLHLYNCPKWINTNQSMDLEFGQDPKGFSQLEWFNYKRHYHLPLDLNCSCEDSLNDSPGRCLFQAEMSKVDLIVLSSKGQSNSDCEMLGSFSKELLQINQDFPLLLMRDKSDLKRQSEALKVLQH